MLYVMSDIHGEFDKFIKMLKKINFNSNDTLYIIGDIFDRGPNALEILEYIKENSNVYLIKGNHEQMFLNFFEFQDPYKWIYNGGVETYNSVVRKGFKYGKELYEYINNLPYYIIVDKFILVHAGVYIPENNKELDIESIFELNNEQDCLWSKNFVGKEKKYKDYTIICGHTPVQKIEKDRKTIFFVNGTIYVDCGCGFDDGRLGCLRLDDLFEFYVD